MVFANILTFRVLLIGFRGFDLMEFQSLEQRHEHDRVHVHCLIDQIKPWQGKSAFVEPAMEDSHPGLLVKDCLQGGALFVEEKEQYALAPDVFAQVPVDQVTQAIEAFSHVYSIPEDPVFEFSGQ